MALVPDQKFSTFQNGGDLEVNDIIVGLRDGLNTRFNYTGSLPVGFIVPVAQGGTGADNAADARTNLGLGTMAVQNANAVAITGGTAALASGSVIAAPVSGTDIANKDYVDQRTDLHFMEAVLAASTANFTSTYDNGTAGVGATLTATSNGAFSLDGEAGVLDARYLIKNQTNTFENGIYNLTQVGDGSNPAILTRSADFNQASEIDPGDIVPVLNGTVNGSTAWIQTATVTTIGTDPIVFSQFIANFTNVVTINGTQTITGAKTFDNNVVIGNSSTFDINSTTAVDGINNDNTLATASATTLSTDLAIKTYIDNATPTNGVVQSVTTSLSTGASTSAGIPFDNTIPQITEGAQFTSVTITPTNAANKIVIEVLIPVFTVSTQGTTVFQTAIFQSPNADAIVACYGGTYNQTHNVRCEVVAGSTAARTYTFRFGTAGSGTAYCNTTSAGVIYGGANVATMTATEYKA